MYLKFEKPGGNVSMHGEFLQGVVREVPEIAGKALLKVKGYVETTKEEFDKQQKEIVEKEKAKNDADKKAKKKEVKP